MKTKTKRVQKLITVSSRLYHLAILNAGRLGLSFPEYVRYLLTKEADSKIEEIPMVDEATEKRIGKSLEDLERGNYTVVDPSDRKALERALGF